MGKSFDLLVKIFLLLVCMICLFCLQCASGTVVVLRLKNISNLTLTEETKANLAQQATDVQNCCRAAHGASPLSLDSGVSGVSQNWANHLAQIDQMVHSGNHQYGENLFASGGGRPLGNGGTPIYYWYQEANGYNYGSNSNQGKGHFTQLVWKGSNLVGFGFASSSSWTYVVANYAPAGNNGQYTANVGAPTSDPSSCFSSIQQEDLELDDDEIQVL